MAEHDGLAVLLGEPVQLLVEDRPEVEPRPLGQIGRRVVDQPPFPPVPPRRGPPSLERHPMGDAVEPGGQQLALADRVGLLDQDQERGLECVLDVAGVAEQPPGDPEDHRPVPAHQGLEGGLGRLGASGGEPFEQLAVGHRRGRAVAEQPVDLTDRVPRLPARHRLCLLKPSFHRPRPTRERYCPLESIR
jgi:hypothetical protein